MSRHLITKFFESRFRYVSQIWAWFMRRRGYSTGYAIRHFDITKYLVRAQKEVEENE